MIVLVYTQEVISTTFQKETIKNRFNWPLNSCSENVQVVQSMREFTKLFTESLNLENLLVNLRKNLVTV